MLAQHAPARPGMRLVEENLISPDTLTQAPTADSATGPRKQARRGEVYDLGDDLMEHVSLRGGQLALVRDGDLRAHERIAPSSRR